MRTDKGTLSDILTAEGGGWPSAPHLHTVGRSVEAPSKSGPSALELAGAALELAATAAAAARYARGAKAPATRRAYELDWRDWAAWCAVRGLEALPATPDTVSFYLADCASRLRVSTIARRLVVIGAAHEAAGAPNPAGAKGVRSVWAGIQRAHGAPPQRKTPLVVGALRACCDALGEDLRGRRDRALLLVGFAGALRRSELVALTIDDIEEARPDGVILHVRHSKTDPFSRGRPVGIPLVPGSPYCPCAALTSWIVAARLHSGPLFVGVSQRGTLRRRALADRQVARIVKRVADQAGLVGDYSGHSLRAGLATSAAAAGASERSIMAQTGHKSVLIARSYIRPASLFGENAAAMALLERGEP